MAGRIWRELPARGIWTGNNWVHNLMKVPAFVSVESVSSPTAARLRSEGVIVAERSNICCRMIVRSDSTSNSLVMLRPSPMRRRLTKPRTLFRSLLFSRINRALASNLYRDHSCLCSFLSRRRRSSMRSSRRRSAGIAQTLPAAADWSRIRRAMKFLCRDADCPLLAHMRPLGMSALPPLLKHDRTSVQPILDCCPTIATGAEATKRRFPALNGHGGTGIWSVAEPA